MDISNLKRDTNFNEIPARYPGTQDEDVKNEKFLTLETMLSKRKLEPEIKFLFMGIKENSFGIVFGPSKSGKTIFCENLAMSIAIGKSEFAGGKLDGRPRRVLFISLEEYWINRVDRNKVQIEALDEREKQLVLKNYCFQNISLPKYIIGDKQWEDLIDVIVSSKSEVVIIDSLTRMNPGEIEKSKDAELVMKKLRDICYTYVVTLIVIHHSRKGIDTRLTMDSIKGSSVLSQETDFAIGIGKTSKNDRYIKQVYYRYSRDDYDYVQPFEISDGMWLNMKDKDSEDRLLSKADRRVDNSKLDYLIDFLNKNSNRTFKTADLIKVFVEEGEASERSLNNHLKEAESLKLIRRIERGLYQSINSN